MRNLGNDIAHIFFAIVVLGLTRFGLWGYILASLMIGLLAELKERDSNVLKVSWGEVSLRDIIGYIVGGLIIGLLLSGCNHVIWPIFHGGGNS